MTTLAVGSSVTLTVGDGGTVTVSTNGGIGSVTITPTVGSAISETFGPAPFRKVYGDFKEGASVVVSNSTCATLDYDWQVGNSAAVKDLVSTYGNLTAPLNLAYPLPKWRKALSDAISGVADARVIFIGDSTTAGLLPASTGSWSRTATALAAKLLSARGVPVNANSFTGDQGRQGGATFTTFDPRVTLGANWSSAAAGQSFAAGSPIGNTAGSGTFSFTPTDPVTGAAYAFDTIDVYYVQNTAYGSFTIGVDGGAAIGATVACAGTRGLQVATRATTLAGHTVNINATVSGQIYILYIVCSNSAQKAVRIMNHGGGSYTSTNYLMGTVGDFTPTAALTNNALSAPLAPHLAIVDLGINDRRLAAYTSTFDTNMQSLITRLQAVGSDIILCKPVPSDITYSSFTTRENQDLFDAAIDRLAVANGLQVYSKRARLQAYEISNPMGYYADGLHLTYGGYAAQAVDLANLLLA